MSTPQNRRKTGKPIPGGEATRFKPGQSGNPGGRPKKTPLADACRELLNKPAPDDPSGRSYAEAIAERLARKALAGDISAAREIADRAEGKARQAMELGGVDGGPVRFEGMSDEQLDQRLEELLEKWKTDHHNEL
jgi:hypothetical protein